MSNVDNLLDGYHSFFKKTLVNTAFSPFIASAKCAYHLYPSPPDDNPYDDGLNPVFCALGTTCMLIPILLPLTIGTSMFALLLGIAAGTVFPLAYGIAAAQDSCAPNTPACR